MTEATEQLDADAYRDEVIRRMANTPPKSREESMPPKKARATPENKLPEIQHYSDCEVNNAPALEPGRCTCGGFKAGR